jgi:hypothetical protein
VGGAGGGIHRTCWASGRCRCTTRGPTCSSVCHSLTRASTRRVYCTFLCQGCYYLMSSATAPRPKTPPAAYVGAACVEQGGRCRLLRKTPGRVGPCPVSGGGLQYTMQTSSGLRQHRRGPIKVSRDWLEHPPDGRHVASWGTVGFTCGSRMLSPLCEGTSHLAQQYSGGQDARA